MITAVLSLSLALGAQDAAAPGRWLAPGGDPAGSASSYARPLRQEPEVAWTWSSTGSIESEVSTWDGQVLLSVRESAGRRSLVLLDLESGALRLKQTLRASEPLLPTMDGDAIAVRPSQERVDVYRLRDGRIGRPRTIRAKRSISAPLLVEGELYLRIDDQLQRLELNRNQPTWTAQLPGVARGRPALHGSRVFSLYYGEAGEAQLAMLDRATGRLLDSIGIGEHQGQLPTAELEASVHPSSHRVFIHYPLPVRTQKNIDYSFGSVALLGTGFAESPASLHQYSSAPLIYRDGWVASEAGATASWLRITRETGSWTALPLADARTQPQMQGPARPAALAGDVIYFGGLAADLGSERVLWKREPSLFRPTPFDRGLLVVEEAKTLTALRAPEPPRSKAELAALAHAEHLDSERAGQLAELAQRSIRIGDGSLTRRLIDQAQRLGAPSKSLDAAFRALDRIAKNSKPANPAGNSYRALLEEEAALHARPTIELVKLAALAEGELERALLREALERDPQQPEAISHVRALLPKEALVSDPFPALSWLEFLDVQARIPVQLTDLRSADAEQLSLAKERDRWRPDLMGFRSESLQIIAAASQPGAVASCLETGELLCDILEQLFQETSEPSAAPASPMLLLLYPTRDEYITQSMRAHSAPEEALGWTAGHYSARENKSRLYVPQDHEAGGELLEVYAHELTHHWLATRAPFASRSGAASAPFWIVEGFATLVSEFQLAPRSSTWQARNPRAGSLDTLNAIPAGSHLPWDEVLGLDHSGFAQLSKTPHMAVPLSWTLGLHSSLSETQLFYTQASAMAQTLYNGSPQTRQQLLAYVRAWYTQDLDQLDVLQAFGTTAERLGRRSLDFGRRN